MAPEPFEVKYVRILNARGVHFDLEGTKEEEIILQLPQITRKGLQFLNFWRINGWELPVCIENPEFLSSMYAFNSIYRITTELIFLNGIPGNRHSLELHLKGETASCAQERLEYPLDRTMIFK